LDRSQWNGEAMLYFLIALAFASIPDSAWRAAEREHYQQSVFNEQEIIGLLQKACREGHSPLGVGHGLSATPPRITRRRQ